MGNQGMTNWKFSVFFVIALALVAGLFADTALARNGDGTIDLVVGSTGDTDGSFNAVFPEGAQLVPASTGDPLAAPPKPAIPQVLKANSAGLGLMFTYTADDPEDGPINMNGGKVRIIVDATWKVKVDNIRSVSEISDTTEYLYLVGARLTDDENFAIATPASAGVATMIRGPALKAARGDRRITLSVNGDGFVTRIEVELDEFAWNVDRADGRKLQIVITGVTAPIPTRLSTVRGVPYKNYQFTTSSTVTGSFVGLTDNDVGEEAQPSIKIGNIASAKIITVDDSSKTVVGAGEVTASPTMYVGDEGDFKITFTAAGPIYDVDTGNDGVGTGDDLNIDAAIVINLVRSLPLLKRLQASLPKKIWVDSTALGTPAPPPADPANPGNFIQVDLKSPPAVTDTQRLRLNGLMGTVDGLPQTADRQKAGFISLTKQSGVSLGNPALTLLGASGDEPVTNLADAQRVRINIVNMDIGEVLELTYKKVWAFGEANGKGAVDFVDVVVTSDSDQVPATTSVGEILERPGTGTIEVTDVAVQINTPESFDIKYTADTAIEGAYLVVALPNPNPFLMPDASDDTQLVPLTLTAVASSNSNGYPVGNYDADNPHPNGDNPRSRYGRVENFRVSHNSGNVAQTVTDNVIMWGPLFLPAKGTLTADINNVRITDQTGVYPWTASLSFSRPTDGLVQTADALDLDEVVLYVLQADANPTDPDVTFEILNAKALPLSTLGSPSIISEAGQGGFNSYDASGRYRITFRFTAVRTPINKGSVSFTLPDGWSPANETAGTPGYISTGTPSNGGRTVTVDELDLAIDGMQDIVYGAPSDPDDAVNDDMVGAFTQDDASDEIITSTFNVGGGIRARASNEINLTVGNVAAGAGKATIRQSSVEAGSLVSLTVTYTADGTMDGGRVALQMPDNWGDLQNTDDDEDNYVQVTASGGTLGDWDVTDDIVEVDLTTFGESNRVNFALKNVVAQPSNLGVVNFRIYSAGKGGEELDLVVGEQPPDGAYTNEGADLSKLLGRVYTTDCIDNGGTSEREDYDGFLRVAVTGGGDGGGEVAVEILASANTGDYDYDDAGTATLTGINQLHAGDADKSANLLFTFTPIETIIDGELKFSVPSGWADPQTDSPSTAGFTVVDSGGRIGSPDATGDSITVPIYLINRDDTITIDYGTDSGGVTPPTSMGTETFTIAVKGSATGRFKPVLRGNSSVDIRPQATGKGTATVSADGTLYAGSTGNTITIKYTAAGQVVDGDLKITVPENWSPATADTFGTISGAEYGGEMTDAERAADDPDDFADDAVGMRQLIVRGIDLRAGGTYSVTYEDVTVQATATVVDVPVLFTIEFRGNSGPGIAFGPVGVPVDETGTAIDADAQKVDVLDVEPGSGTVAVRGPAVVTVGLDAYEITIIYTAKAQISEDKVIAVQIPEGWSDPIDDDQAMDDDGNYNEGTYTVVHKMADGTSFTDRYGDPIDGMVEKADVADRMLMASVTGDGVAAGETVIFTFQNATASEDAGPSTFQVYYDGAKVESDDDVVLVQSGEGAAMLALSSEEDTFIIDEGGSLTVTVMLQAADGSAATRAVDTVIALESSSDNGSFDPATVTIAAGETMGTSDYSDGSVGSVEITASTDATDVAAADALTITANTEMPMLESVDFSPKVVKDLATVTVTAMGTAFQNPTFMIEDVNFSGISMTEDAGDGTYTGSYRLARGSTEGMHSVTVTINGVSLAADDMLTVDNTMPSVTVTAPAAGITVINGQEITITATVTDATDVTVTADVSMLDSEAEADSVMLTDGTGMHTIDMNNSNLNDEYTITVTATDAAGNVGVGMVTVMLDNTRSFTSMIPSGLSMFHVPLMVEGMDTIGDLKAALGDDVISAIPYHGGKWEPDSDDVEITADLGMFLVTKGAIEHEFVGHPWGGGSAMISVTAGANNLIGVPVADPNVTMISDIIGLFPADVVQAIVIASGDGEYPQISGADDPDDAEVKGDAAYLVIAASDGSAMVSGAGWSTGGMASAAPIALSGYQLDTQTPLISVYGSVVDEITGLAREGFRAKVKNLSTKAALSEITSVEAADGYSITFVDLTDAHAARVGDVLEISADSPDPLVGVKPVRHIVTVDDVKNSRIELESLIAYEIPAETELLRNYPNPFNPETWIPYRLAEDADVSLTIYDTNGATVRSIDIGHQIAAVYDTRAKAIYWDGRNRFGEQVASGLYFYHLSAGDFSGTRRMVILK